jgi:enoyl-CoA hydratase/carnithine racemase
MKLQHVLFEKSGGVAHITLNRPDKLNALGIGPGSIRDEIAKCLIDADADAAVGAVLISANGRAFCAGGDLTGAPKTETVLDEHLFGEELVRFYEVIRSMHKPVVAAVHGLCLGAGLGFMAQCDLVIAADDARFGLIEGRIGHPGATEIVPLVGAAWAKFMMLTGELISARRAADIGLILLTVPAAALLDRARDLATRIASLPRESVLLNKACIDKMTDAMGRANGRVVGRLHDTMTKAMSTQARAPDGRTFDEILKSEGIEGVKRGRDAQFKGSWLDTLSGASDKNT